MALVFMNIPAAILFRVPMYYTWGLTCSLINCVSYTHYEKLLTILPDLFLERLYDLYGISSCSLALVLHFFTNIKDL